MDSIEFLFAQNKTIKREADKLLAEKLFGLLTPFSQPYASGTYALDLKGLGSFAMVPNANDFT